MTREKLKQRTIAAFRALRAANQTTRPLNVQMDAANDAFEAERLLRIIIDECDSKFFRQAWRNFDCKSK